MKSGPKKCKKREGSVCWLKMEKARDPISQLLRLVLLEQDDLMKSSMDTQTQCVMKAFLSIQS